MIAILGGMDFPELTDEKEAHIAEIIKRHITKIYAHNDGGFTVNVGVHIKYCGGRI